MADPSCSHWWHAPLYVSMSLLLAFNALTTLNRSRPQSPLPPGHDLAFNASRALRLRGGFHTIATLLQLSPDLFFSGPPSTLFAIPDSAISNLSLPPWELRQLLRYHTAPYALPAAALRNEPPGFCFKTLLRDKNLALTKNDAASLMINNVGISDPDIFLQGPLAVHGVLGSFNIIPSPSCWFYNQSTLLGRISTQQSVDWTRIIRLLSSKGFVSFAIGLNAVLDRILEEHADLGEVTVFAPPNSGFISSSSPFLDRIVRLHILPQRFTYLELAAVRSSSLRTLVPGSDLKISNFSHNLAINRVRITRPDMFAYKEFVVHGISREFDLEEFFTSLR